MINFLRNLLGGAMISAIIGMLTYFLQYTQVRYWYWVVSIVAILIAIIINLFNFKKRHRRNRAYSGTPSSTSGGCTLLIIIPLILLMIPLIFFTWILNPGDIEKSIKITVFIMSTIGSIIYYLLYTDKFKGPGDIVGFFAGAIGGPIAVVQIFL